MKETVKDTVPETVKVTLNSGLELSLDKNALDDMELLDALVNIDDGNGYGISRAVTRLLGKEEKKKLYDSLRVNGRTPVTAVTSALSEIFEKLGETGKN